MSINVTDFLVEVLSDEMPRIRRKVIDRIADKVDEIDNPALQVSFGIARRWAEDLPPGDAEVLIRRLARAIERREPLEGLVNENTSAAELTQLTNVLQDAEKVQRKETSRWLTRFSHLAGSFARVASRALLRAAI